MNPVCMLFTHYFDCTCLSLLFTNYFDRACLILLAVLSDEDDAKLQADLAEGYLRFLQAKDENQRQEGTRLAKRTKKAKVTSRLPPVVCRMK